MIFASYKEWDASFHRYLVSKAGDQYLTDIYQRIEGKHSLIAYHICKMPVKRRLGVEKHREIITALKNSDLEKAEEKMRKHFDGVKNDVFEKFLPNFST